MKRIMLILMIVCGIGFTANAQSTKTEEDYFKNLNLSPKDTLMFQYMEIFRSQLREPEFQLFKTQNMWTFLKLNTRTGQIWQVQWSTEPENRGVMRIY